MKEVWRTGILEIMEATEGMSCPDKERFLQGYNAAHLGGSVNDNPHKRQDYAYMWSEGFRISRLNRLKPPST